MVEQVTRVQLSRRMAQTSQKATESGAGPRCGQRGGATRAGGAHPCDTTGCSQHHKAAEKECQIDREAQPGNKFEVHVKTNKLGRSLHDVGQLGSPPRWGLLGAPGYFPGVHYGPPHHQSVHVILSVSSQPPRGAPHIRLLLDGLDIAGLRVVEEQWSQPLHFHHRR